MKPQHALRLVLAVVAVVLCMVVLRSFLHQDRCGLVLAVLVDRLSLVGWALCILAAALSSGCALLRRLRLQPDRPGPALLFGVGVGLGLVSVLTLVLGVVGLCSAAALTLMLVLLLVIGLPNLGRLLAEAAGHARKPRRLSPFRVALWCVLGLFLLMNLTRAFEPPWDYDSLEYHVAAPAAYHRAGRVVFIRDNVYANFPQNTEMLYFLGMRLTGSPDRGATVGQLLVAALGFLAALALRSMVAGLAGREVGDVAAVFLYTWPGVTVYSGVPYVELPLMFYGTLALWALLWSWRRKRTAPGPRGWIILSAVAAGLALGVKYTAALLVVAPIVAWLILLGILYRMASRETVRRVVTFVAVVLLAFSPWLIRNAVNTRNPVYPLLYKVFGSSNWDAQKDARWTRAHSPGSRQPAHLAAQTRELLLVNQHKASLLLLLFVPLVLLAGRRTRALAALLVAHAVLLLLLWLFFTQHNERFLDVGVPVLAALSALGLGSVLGTRWGVALRPTVVLLLLIAPPRWVNYANVERSLGIALGLVSRDRYFAGPADIDYKYGYAAMKYVNDRANLSPGSRILMLGEARTFYCRRDHIASTVFDTNFLEGVVRRSKSPQDIAAQLKAARVTHIFVDTAQLARLQRTYRYSYQDREYLGMLDGFDWDCYARFARAHLAHVKTFAGAGAEDFPWQTWNEFREDPARFRRPHFIALYALRQPASPRGTPPSASAPPRKTPTAHTRAIPRPARCPRANAARPPISAARASAPRSFQGFG